jgi:hypothetical protein
VKRAIAKRILKFLQNHPFATIQQIKKQGIIKKRKSLRNLLELLVEEKKIECIKFCKWYYVTPIPKGFEGFEKILVQAELTFRELKNPKIKQGLFYQQFLSIHKRYCTNKGVKTTNSRRLDELIERSYIIKSTNERCLLKAFVSLVLKLIIIRLEIEKMKNSGDHTINSERITEIMNPHLIYFELIFRNYDPCSNNIAGTSYYEIEENLDQMYLKDSIYYKQLKSNEISLFTKLSYAIEYLVEDDKTNIAIFNYYKNKKRIFSGKIPLATKNTKAVTHLINSLYDHRGFPDLEKIHQLQRIESNRLLRYNVPDSLISLFLILSMWRCILRSIPRYDPDYDKLKKIMQKRLPEFVIS